MLLFDKKDDTSWQEGVAGYGINESVSFSFDGIHKVKYIAFKLGNWKNDKYYYGNAKPKTVNLVFGDYSGQVTFTGERKVEWVEVCAMASIVIDNAVAVHEVKIINGPNRKFIAMPSRKEKDGTYRDLVHLSLIHIFIFQAMLHLALFSSPIVSLFSIAYLRSRGKYVLRCYSRFSPITL